MGLEALHPGLHGAASTVGTGLVLRALGPAETKGKAQDVVSFTLVVGWALLGEGHTAALLAAPGLGPPRSCPDPLGRASSQARAGGTAGAAHTEPAGLSVWAVEAVLLEILLRGSRRASNATAPRQGTPQSTASAIPSHWTRFRGDG